jgi:glycerophosphoryl diester phosphodiesterase
MVEVKPTSRDRELGPLVARALVGRGLLGQSLMASFSAPVIASAAEAEPKLPIMALLDSETEEASFQGLPLFAFGVDRALLSRERVARWKSGGREVWTWTIKTLPEMQEALAAGVDGLISDIPGEVLKHM